MRSDSGSPFGHLLLTLLSNTGVALRITELRILPRGIINCLIRRCRCRYWYLLGDMVFTTPGVGVDLHLVAEG